MYYNYHPHFTYIHGQWYIYIMCIYIDTHTVIYRTLQTDIENPVCPHYKEMKRFWTMNIFPRTIEHCSNPNKSTKQKNLLKNYCILQFLFFSDAFSALPFSVPIILTMTSSDKLHFSTVTDAPSSNRNGGSSCVYLNTSRLIIPLCWQWVYLEITLLFAADLIWYLGHLCAHYMAYMQIRKTTTEAISNCDPT